MPQQKLSLTVRYDYITLRTPNGNFTSNRSGFSASGRLAIDRGACKRIDEHITAIVKGGGTYGDAMKTLTDAAVLGKLWPAWDATQATPPQIGDLVMLDGFPKYAVGEVKEYRKTKLRVFFPTKGEHILVDAYLLKKLTDKQLRLWMVIKNGRYNPTRMSSMDKDILATKYLVDADDWLDMLQSDEDMYRDFTEWVTENS